MGRGRAVRRPWRSEFGAALDVKRLLDDEPGLDEAGLRARILAAVEERYLKKFEAIEPAELRQLEKQLMLQQVDLHWKEHLAAMDYLRQGIHLRGYAQKNPKQEYKREAFEMFGAMLDQVKRDVVTILAKARVRSPEEIAAEEERRRMAEQLQYRHDEAPSAMAPEGTEPEAGSRRMRRALPRRAPATGRPAATAARPRRRRRPRRWCVARRRWAGTSPVPAAPARSTSSATAAWTDHGRVTHCCIRG